MPEQKNKPSSTVHLIEQRPPHPNETPLMVINDISHLFHGKMRSAETEGILSQNGARMILNILAHHEGLRQVDLARMMHMQAPTISILVKKMSAEGLLTNAMRMSDLRSSRLYLTDEGRECYEKTQRLLRSTEEIIMDGFSRSEVKELNALLDRMRNNLLNDLEAGGLLRPAPDLSEIPEEE